MRPCSTEPSHCRSISRAARQAPALPGCLPAAAQHGQQAPRGTAPGQPRWPPASCLGVVWTAHQRDREEGATVRLTSREKQSTEGVGQGRRGFSLKERKREGEAVTLKDREGELVAQGWLGGLLVSGHRGQGGREGKVTFSLDGGEEGGCTQSSNCRAQRCLHLCPFRSQQHE